MSHAIACACPRLPAGVAPVRLLGGAVEGVDLRKVGSGNTGGTNAIRILGARYGVPVILLDMGKGVAAVLIAGQFGGATVEVLAATGAVLGHAFPVFLRFHGGKAVAVGAGAMFALTPLIGVLVTLVWFVVAALTRYVSLASLARRSRFLRSPSSSTSPGRYASSRWPVGCS